MTMLFIASGNVLGLSCVQNLFQSYSLKDNPHQSPGSEKIIEKNNKVANYMM